MDRGEGKKIGSALDPSHDQDYSVALLRLENA
jgi:hypothetical protein